MSDAPEGPRRMEVRRYEDGALPEHLEWQAMDGVVTLTGPRGEPRVHKALRMMLFASDKGREVQGAFQSEALHVEHGW